VGYALLVLAVIAALGAAVFAFRVLRSRRVAAVPQPPVQVTRGEVQLVRPNPRTVEGMEIRYGADGLVRAVRVGAMNSEHKELMLTMDGMQWNRMPNAQKQEVVAAARSTWAEKMCGAGPDIAYLVVQTEAGDIVARAGPHSVTVL
jgi:hypothetical protein